MKRNRELPLRATALAAVLLFGGTGCASLVGARKDQLPRAGAGTTFHAMDWRGRTRTFLLHLPPRIRKGGQVPLVVVLHGSGANANVVMDESQMNDRADSAGFAVAYPNGTGWLRYFFLTWNSGRCCGDAHRLEVDDVGFIRAMVERIVATLPVDGARVFATGFSDGGRMVYRLACDEAPVFAGVAVVSGGPPDSSCTPELPVSVDIFHGTADRTMGYGATTASDGRETDSVPVSVPETFQWWARRDGCRGEPVRVVTDSVVTERFRSCRSGTAVELNTIVGGQHAWPGGTRGFFTEPRPSRTIDASAEMLRFFADHGR